MTKAELLKALEPVAEDAKISLMFDPDPEATGKEIECVTIMLDGTAVIFADRY
jgi:hypothetical protein